MATNENVIATVAAYLSTNEITPAVVRCTQYDSTVKLIRFDLFSQGKAWTVPDGYTANVRYKKPDGKSVYDPCEIGGSSVYVTLSEQMCLIAGTAQMNVEIISGENAINTALLAVVIKANALDGSEEASTDERETVEKAAKRAEVAADSAESAAESARDYNQACLKVYNATKSEKEEAKTASAEAEKSAEEAKMALTTLLGTCLPSQYLPRTDYSALTPPHPRTLYIVEEDNPAQAMTACYPLRTDLSDQLDSTKTATAVGCDGIADWDGTGTSFRTLNTVQSLTLTDFVAAGTYKTNNYNYAVISETGYSISCAGSETVASVTVTNNPLVAGRTYTIAYSAGVTSYVGGSVRLVNSSTSDTLALITLSSASAGSGSQSFTAPDDVADYDTLEFYGAATGSYTRSVTITGFTAPAESSTMHKNYLTLPEGLFSESDYSDGVSFSIDIKPDTLADWTSIFRFYDSANGGDLYATQGVTVTGYWNSTTVQQMGYGNYQCVTAGTWHSFVFTVSPTQLKVYVDGALKTTATDSGSTLKNLLANLGTFTTNWLGNSRFSDNDFAGLMRNFKIYSKELSAAEVAQVGTNPSVSLYWGSTLLASGGAS